MLLRAGLRGPPLFALCKADPVDGLRAFTTPIKRQSLIFTWAVLTYWAYTTPTAPTVPGPRGHCRLMGVDLTMWMGVDSAADSLDDITVAALDGYDQQWER